MLWPHSAIIAILWTLAALLPQDRFNLPYFVMTMIASGISRWMLLGWFAGSNTLACFIAIETVPRAAMIALAWTSRPANLGVIDRFCSTLASPVAILSIATGAAAAFAIGLRIGLVIILGSYVLIRAIRWFAYRFLGGITADTLGITQLLTELGVLLLFGCSACRW